jgi:hypothetical protein
VTGRIRTALAAGFLTVAYAATAEAQSGGDDVARRSFEDGVALEKKGDFAGALAKFQESERAKPTLGNRFHKAYCLEMTGKLVAALDEYEGVDRAAREAKKADIVEATRVRREPLEAKIPQVTLKLGAPAPSVEVTLDGAPVAAEHLDGKAFRIESGAHALVARAPDHDTFTKDFTAADGSTTTIDIVLPVTAPSAPTADAAPPPSETSSRSVALPVVTTAGAIVLAGGAVGAFLVAGSKQTDLEKTCATKPSCEDDKSSTRTFDGIALGAAIGAAGLAALSVVLWTSKPASTSVVARSSWVGLEGRF